jgi:hypothetical protein
MSSGKAPGELFQVALESGDARVGWAAVDAVQAMGPSAIEIRPAWLDPAEWHEAEVLIDRGRRWQWLAGRWVARLALGFSAEASRVRVLSRDQRGRGTRPMCWCGDAPYAGSLSITHSDELAVAVVSNAPIGADVVRLGPTCRPDLDLRQWAAAEATSKLCQPGRCDAISCWVELGDEHFSARAGELRARGRFVTIAQHLIAVCGADGRNGT